MATKRSTRPSPSRSAATTPRPRPSGSTMPGLVGHVDEPAAVVAEEVIGQGGERFGGAVAVRRPCRRASTGRARGSSGVPVEVVADVEVEVAVAVEVGEGGRGRPVAVPAQARRLGHVLERPVALVAVEGVGPPAGDEQVGVAVVVDNRRRPRRGRSRRACPPSPARSVTSSKVPSPRLRNRRSPRVGTAGSGGKGPPWTK